jgi:hypothetical protein
VGNQIDSAFGTGNFFEEFLNRAMKDQSKGGTATMLILRKVMLIALFLLLVGVSFAVLWLPVVKMLMRFHSGWNGFPSGLFDVLWVVVTLGLNTILIAGLF